MSVYLLISEYIPLFPASYLYPDASADWDNGLERAVMAVTLAYAPRSTGFEVRPGLGRIFALSRRPLCRGSVLLPPFLVGINISQARQTALHVLALRI